MIRARRQDASTVRTKVKRWPVRLEKGRPWPSRTKVKGGDEFARGRIPEPGVVVDARRENPSAVRTKRDIQDIKRLGIAQGGNKLARGCIPEPDGCIHHRADATWE